MNENGVERAAGVSKNFVAILALVSVVAGGIGGGLSAFLFLNKQLEIWRQIKAAHDAPVPNSDAIVHNHSKLGADDIAAIRKDLALPDFGTFAARTDLPDVSDVVRYSDQIGIKVLLSRDGTVVPISLDTCTSDVPT